MTIGERNEVVIRLTDEQREQIRKEAGVSVDELRIDVAADALESASAHQRSLTDIAVRVA